MMGLNGKFNYFFAKLQTHHTILIFPITFIVGYEQIAITFHSTKISSRYSGIWKDNLPHGQGEYVWSNGNSFEGEYFKGEQEGFGVLRMLNGDTFTGDIRQGMPHGKGTLVFGNNYSIKSVFSIAMLIKSHI